MKTKRSLCKVTWDFQETLIEQTTGDYDRWPEYDGIRKELMSDVEICPLLPECVAESADIKQFREWMKRNLKTYRQRRKLIREQFVPILDHLYTREHGADPKTEPAHLSVIDREFVLKEWGHLLEEVIKNPEYASHGALDLLGDACRRILSESGCEYRRYHDVIQLYDMASRCLKIRYRYFTASIYKRLVHSSHDLSKGLQEVNLRLQDTAEKESCVTFRYNAELAVNTAASMALLLVGSWDIARKNSKIYHNAQGVFDLADLRKRYPDRRSHS